ncbi:hypothetical protein V8C86DRAFT_2560066 [Haematococcus lacustris]
MEKEEEAVICMQSLADQVANSSHLSEREVQVLRASLVDQHGELVLLLHWSLLNFAAVVKIVKKHDKLRTGIELRAAVQAVIMHQPFSSTAIMQKLIHQADRLVAQLASAQAPSQPLGTPKAMTPPPPSEGDSSSGQASSSVSERPLGQESMRLVPPLLHGTVDQGPVSQGQGPLPSLSSNALSSTLVSDIGVTPPCVGITLPEADEELKYKKAQEMAGLVADSHLFRRMQQAMEMWATLSTTASTPSTVLPASLTEDLQAHLQRLASRSHRPRVSLSPQQQPCMQPGPPTHTPRTSAPCGATATVATAAAAAAIGTTVSSQQQQLVRVEGGGRGNGFGVLVLEGQECSWRQSQGQGRVQEQQEGLRVEWEHDEGRGAQGQQRQLKRPRVDVLTPHSLGEDRDEGDCTAHIIGGTRQSP